MAIFTATGVWEFLGLVIVAAVALRFVTGMLIDRGHTAVQGLHDGLELAAGVAGGIIACAIVVSAGLLGGADPFTAVASLWAGRAFDAERSHYQALCQQPTSALRPDSLVRKVVIVHADTGEVHHTFAGLDVTLRAEKPEEATTLACVARSTVQTGRYTDGARAYAVVYDVTAVDTASGVAVARQIIEGSPPEDPKSSPGDKTGLEPDDALLRWLRSLAKP